MNKIMRIQFKRKQLKFFLFFLTFSCSAFLVLPLPTQSAVNIFVFLNIYINHEKCRHSSLAPTLFSASYA